MYTDRSYKYSFKYFLMLNFIHEITPGHGARSPPGCMLVLLKISRELLLIESPGRRAEKRDPTLTLATPPVGKPPLQPASLVNRSTVVPIG